MSNLIKHVHSVQALADCWSSLMLNAFLLMERLALDDVDPTNGNHAIRDSDGNEQVWAD
jgi:hypothetical protein